MYSPKFRPPMGNHQVIAQTNDSKIITAIRISLIVWAFLRLVVSSLWTSVIVMATGGQLLAPHSAPASRLFFGAFAIVIQLIEFAMLATFIVAGVKKSVNLYRTYYWYCILSLIVYVISATLCLSLGYDKGHYFGEIYLFYHVYDASGIIGDDELAFFIATVVDVGLEILLICLIRMLIRNYSHQHHGNKYVAGGTV